MALCKKKIRSDHKNLASSFSSIVRCIHPGDPGRRAAVFHGSALRRAVFNVPCAFRRSSTTASVSRYTANTTTIHCAIVIIHSHWMSSQNQLLPALAIEPGPGWKFCREAQLSAAVRSI